MDMIGTIQDSKTSLLLIKDMFGTSETLVCVEILIVLCLIWSALGEACLRQLE